ncbi:hypothetical protein J2847_006573 [Azospirillum agricola]|nr:hypothetical protein [Azospirillum agricola]MBP2233236.1 hypothetical protein [Azospirillum agricola]
MQVADIMPQSMVIIATGALVEKAGRSVVALTRCHQWVAMTD